ncbi:MAG TPA: T9SS type A sorting domain-containing protein [Bacteroidia bacterium]|nr:T9SS type A sorting domain-containing protein [Bacteroidia bacterium]
MKKHFYFYIAFFFLSNCFAQNINMASHRFNEWPGQFVKINNKLFFSSAADTTSFQAPSYVYGINGNTTLFRKGISLNETTTINDMMTTYDKNIVFVGGAHGCDNPNNPTLFLYKMDTTGHIMYYLNLIDSTFTYATGFKKIIEYTDNSFFTVTDSMLYHFGNYGNFISKKRTHVANITAMCLKNNHIVLSSTTTISFPITTNLLTELDTAGNIIKQDTVPYSFTKLKYVAGNCMLGLTSKGLVCKINNALGISSTTQSAQGTYKLTDFSLSNDTVYCSAYDSINQLSVFKTDTAFVNTNLFASVYTSTIPAKIIAGNSSLYFLNIEDSLNNHNSNISVLQMNKANNLLNITQDAGVTNAVLDSAYATASIAHQGTSSSDPSVYYNNYFYRMKVTIKNFGATTLQGCYINNKPYHQVICGVYYYSQYFSGLNLAPNQTVTITTPFIEYEGPVIFGSLPTSPTPASINNVCFWTSAPNQQSDANHNNDTYCTNISFVSTVGINQFLEQQTTISCYPNPTTGSFTVSSTQKIDGITITNLLGEIVAQTNPNAETTQLNISNAGVYFVQVTVGNKTATQKIIITN